MSGSLPADGGKDGHPRLLNPNMLTEEELLGEELQVQTAFGREERLRMLREAQLLEYREKKVVEKIRQLTEERNKELELQKDLTSKELARRQRQEHLKKRLAKGAAQEEQKAGEEKQRKEEELAAQRKALQEEKARQLEIRREVEDWQEKKLRGEIPSRRQTPEAPPPRPEKPKTQRQIEAEEYAQALHAALQQRPPMGELPKRPGARKPRPAASGYVHPSVEKRGETGEASSMTFAGSSGTKHSRPQPVDWAEQTKQVSDAYGLSQDEFERVKEATNRSVTTKDIQSNPLYEH